MNIIHLDSCNEFVAGDNCILKEIFNPNKEELALSYSLAHAKVKPGEKTLAHKLSSLRGLLYLKRPWPYARKLRRRACKGRRHSLHSPQMRFSILKNTGHLELEFLCMVEPSWKAEDENCYLEKPF